jgi:hypothetical protein
MRKAFAALVAALLALLAATGTASAGDGGGHGPKDDVRLTDPDLGHGRKLGIDKRTVPATPQAAVTTTAAATATTPVGTQRVWPVINTVTGNALFRTFTLKAAGENSRRATSRARGTRSSRW